MDTVELEFLPWVSKINEKLTFALLNVREHRDISEEDYSILKFLHKDWYFGEHPLYKTQMGGTADVSVQQGLFSDTPADYKDGTQIVDAF